MKDSIFGKHLFFTAGIGVVFWIIGEILYSPITLYLWQPLGIAVYFAVFGLILFIGYFVLSCIRGDYFYLKHENPRNISENIRMSFLLLAVIFALTIGLEFLYELGIQEISEPTSYVFVIDDSGSMSENDPQNERVSAIRKIMEKQSPDFPYAVYRFTDTCTKLKDMAPYRSGDSYEFYSEGNTNILGALEVVLSELKNYDGEIPRILLLSDGSSSSVGKNLIIDECRENSVSISSISFGNRFTNHLLSDLAKKTGGVYINAADSDELYQQMETAILTSAERNLLSERYTPHLNALYAVLRIVFLTLIGFVWSLFKIFAFCGKGLSGKLPFSIVLCTVGSVLTETLFALSVSGELVRLFFCILWALMPGKFEKRPSGDKSTFHNPIQEYGNKYEGFVAPNIDSSGSSSNLKDQMPKENQLRHTIDQK